MIGDWEDLAYIHGLGHEDCDELKAWLRSQTQNLETTVSTTSHPLGMLRAALQAANLEIRDNLDEQISLLVKEAADYNIRVRQADYYRTRAEDWDGMLPTDIDVMGVEEVVGMMRAARDEIAWLLNKISRLECYISVEKQMERHGVQGRRTILRPLERKNEQHGGIFATEEDTPMKGMDSVFYYSPTSPAVD